MKKIILIIAVLNCFIFLSAQSFEIKQITSGDFDARNPIISGFSFWYMPLVYFELHSADSSNIVMIGYEPYTDVFSGITALTTGNAMKINPYEDFNHGIAYQTNENGNWDIAFRPFENGNWGETKFLTNTPEDEINLSPFYEWEAYGPLVNLILFQRLDTIFVLEYNESVISEYPVLVNSSQYYYTDFIGIYCDNFFNYPRKGIHVIAVENDMLGNKSLVYKYKPFNGQWEEKSFIKENCECKNPSLQFLAFTPHLIFEDSTSDGFRPFSVYDWDYEKDIQPIPDLLSGNISDFKVDRPDLITLNPSPYRELEYVPHSYFVKYEDDLKIRLNKWGTGALVGDTLIGIKANNSRITLGALGLTSDEVFYTIWEDSADGNIHLFGRRQLYPVGSVFDETGIDGFILEQNFPNPFNSSTTIAYNLEYDTFVSLIVYDCLGENIKTLVNEFQEAGTHRVIFESDNLPSGLYFLRIIAGPWKDTKKMVYLK